MYYLCVLGRIPGYGGFDMTTITTLGPANIFSELAELAAKKYGKEISGLPTENDGGS